MIRTLCPVVLLTACVCVAVCLPAAEAAQPCESDIDCSGADTCVGGACVPPVPDPHAYTAEAMPRWTSYIWAVQFPSLFEPTAEQCCFDYTGDGQPDNGFGAVLDLMGTIGGGGEIDVLVNQALENGTLVKVLDWRELASDLASGDVQLSAFDGEWTDATPHTERILGYGHTTFRFRSFGPYGAIDQLNAGTVDNGLVELTGNQLTLAMPGLQYGDMVALHLREPRLQAPVTYGETRQDACLGLCTMDENRGPSHTPQIVGGGKAGGIVAADELLTHLDSFFRQCSCAGIDPAEPVLVWQENTGTQSFQVSCTSNTGNPSNCGPFDPCADLTTVCSTIVFLPLTLDVDLNGNGIRDSWSMGLRLGFSGTTLDPMRDLFLDGFESGDTTRWSVSVP